MNRKAIAVQAALLLVVAGAAQLAAGRAAAAADGLVEGKDYKLLSPAQPTSSPEGKVEVAEVFMFSCPHCFEFEPHWEAWEKHKADYINIVRLPASWNQLAKLHAQAYYTADVLGKLDAIDHDFFDAFHVKHDYLDTVDKLRDFFGKHGVDADTFDKTFNSFAVHTKMQRADDLIKRYQVMGTPSVVVDGKYLTEGSMAGSYKRWFEIIDKLAAREHEAKLAGHAPN